MITGVDHPFPADADRDAVGLVAVRFPGASETGDRNAVKHATGTSAKRSWILFVDITEPIGVSRRMVGPAPGVAADLFLSRTGIRLGYLQPSDRKSVV